jgi:hypothetical protein
MADPIDRSTLTARLLKSNLELVTIIEAEPWPRSHHLSFDPQSLGRRILGWDTDRLPWLGKVTRLLFEILKEFAECQEEYHSQAGQGGPGH